MVVVDMKVEVPGSCANLFFQCVEGFFFLAFALKDFVHTCKECKGEAMKEKFVMNFLYYWATPKKLLTYVTLFCLGQFTMNSTLERSISNSPPLQCNLDKLKMYIQTHIWTSLGTTIPLQVHPIPVLHA